MCMTLTEMSMHDVFFPVLQAKINVQSQLVKLFKVKTARYGHEEKFWSQKMHEAAKQSTQKPPERFRNWKHIKKLQRMQ